MELPKHTCISCAYLCQKADGYYGIAPRLMILEGTSQHEVGAHYIYLICYKGKLSSFYNTGKAKDDIRLTIITPNACKQWTRFINGISPIATEQRESSKWAKRAFWIALSSLVAVLITWALAQFVFD